MAHDEIETIIKDQLVIELITRGPRGRPGVDGQDGDDGADGKSAYQVALDQGFVGTVNQWLASLVGPGIASGGTTGQILSKSSNADYATEWIDAPNSAVWGSISGTLTDQLDLVAALAAKANSSHTHTASEITDFSTAADARITLQKGAADGIAPLGLDQKIASIYLPSFVDDVIEAANFAALPVTGETSKIYVTIDDNKTYRWSGSAYVEISASPGSTDAVTEGVTNLYFTTERAQDAVAAALTNTASITFSYNDALNQISANIPSAGVTNALFRDSAGLSLVGRAANTTGSVADITAASDFQVLRRSGTAIAFGSINLASANAVTGLLPFANIANGSALSVFGRSANSAGVQASIAAASDFQVLRRSGTAIAFGSINLASANAVTGLLPYANFSNGVGLSVTGRASNTSGVQADIAAASDHQVLRRSGTALGFGAVNLASANAVTGLLPLANMTVPGSDTEVIYNNAGNWGVSSLFTFNGSILRSPILRLSEYGYAQINSCGQFMIYGGCFSDKYETTSTEG